ncbi:MAG: hypothetical protein E7218_08035 [Anaerofustis stercorihominis]|nr:hypothetical protein [Anaerofustis stercorihominis]
MNSAKRMAYSSMSVALCVLLMFLGAVLELGVYAAPMLCGVIIACVGERYAKGTSLSVFAATAILCLILVPNIEENMMFAGILGWYPIFKPKFDAVPKYVRIIVKLLLFNTVTILIQAFLINVLMPEVLTTTMIISLLVLANITFILYDYCLPRMIYLFKRLLARF